MKRVVVLCALGVLCGCGQPAEEQPKALPPVVADGTVPSGSPASAQPPTPSSLAAPTPVSTEDVQGASSPPSADAAAQITGASDFARRWIESVNAAYRLVDPSGIATLSDSSCQTCQNYITSLTAAAEQQKRYRGGEITVRETEAPEIEDGRTTVVAVVSYAKLEELDAAGHVLRTLPALARGTLEVTVRESDGKWLVVEVLSS